MTKKSTEEAMLQAMADLAHKMLQQNKERFWFKEGEARKKTERMGGNEPVVAGMS